MDAHAKIHVCVVSTTVYGLIFIKLSASTEQIVDFTTVLVCSRDVAMVTDL